MYYHLRSLALVALLLPLASGCSSVPRWDWWRSAQTGPPPGAMTAANNAPKYPALPSTKSTPENITASHNTGSTNGGTTNPFPPGTAAPASNFPASGSPAGSVASTNQPGSYPSTAAGGANSYPTTGGNYSAQTTPYNAGAYNPNVASQPAAHVASTTNAYGAPSNTNAASGYPGTNTPNYPNTNTGYANPATAGGAAAGYQTGSQYDAPAGDRYGSPGATNYGAPGANTAPAGSGYGNPSPPAGNNYSPPQNYGSPNGYQGTDTGASTGTANYANASPVVGDRYSNASVDAAGLSLTNGKPFGTDPNVTNANSGPIARTADASGALPSGAAYQDSQVIPASGDAYLPAGTKRLEGEMPTSPGSTPASGYTNPPAGNYGQPGSMG